MPDPGALRELVTLEQEVEVDQGGGGSSLEWQPYSTFAAEVLPLSETERVLAQQLGAVGTYRVTCRYRDDVTTEKRLNWNGDILNIRSAVDPDGKRQWIKIIAESGVAT